jgi:hypothetical protein
MDTSLGAVDSHLLLEYVEHNDAAPLWCQLSQVTNCAQEGIIKMTCRAKGTLLLLSTLLITGNSVIAADWKYLGSAKMGTHEYYAYFDSESLQKKDSRYPTVWVKFLKRQQVDSLTIEITEVYSSEIGAKVASNYIPPYSLVDADTSKDEVNNVIISETIANYAYLTARLRVHYEFDCQSKTLRELSIMEYNPAGERIQNVVSPRDWTSVAAETFEEVMMKLFCLKRKF